MLNQETEKRLASWESEFADAVTSGSQVRALNAAGVIDFILNESEYLGMEGQNG